MLYDKKSTIETGTARFNRLQESLESVAVGLDLTALTSFLETGKDVFDCTPSKHQSDPIPPEVIGYEIQPRPWPASVPHKEGSSGVSHINERSRHQDRMYLESPTRDMG